MGHWYCEASITRKTEYKEKVAGLLWGEKEVTKERTDTHFVKGRVLSYLENVLWVVTNEGKNPVVTPVYPNFYKYKDYWSKDVVTVLKWVE